MQFLDIIIEPQEFEKIQSKLNDVKKQERQKTKIQKVKHHVVDSVKKKANDVKSAVDDSSQVDTTFIDKPVADNINEAGFSFTSTPVVVVVLALAVIAILAVKYGKNKVN